MRYGMLRRAWSCGTRLRYSARWVTTVGIVGMGAAGQSLTVSAMRTGDLEVKVVDTPENVKRGLDGVESVLSSDVDGKKAVDLSKVQFVEDVNVLAKESEIIVECLQDEGEKMKVGRVLSEVLRDGVAVASCCHGSTLSKVAGAAGKVAPAFCGIHFFLPPHESSIVEIVTGLETSNWAIQSTMMFVAKLEKQYVVCRDTPGFISERLLVPYINEAAQALSEGIATREDIDKIMELGTRERMGPLSFADQLGLDRCVNVMEMLYRKFGDPKYRPSPLLVQYVDAKRLGRKSGRGFFDY
mmetsp:Transcript_9755/g.29653  ORF Transcript_9755/g.29653 Transcript_9755/m.29653 type:complete len:298 (+) Transcript_9755:66-959(+)